MKNKGFGLIEFVIAVLVSGVILAGIASFMSFHLGSVKKQQSTVQQMDVKVNLMRAVGTRNAVDAAANPEFDASQVNAQAPTLSPGNNSLRRCRVSGFLCTAGRYPLFIFPMSQTGAFTAANALAGPDSGVTPRVRYTDQGRRCTAAEAADTKVCPMEARSWVVVECPGGTATCPAPAHRFTFQYELANVDATNPNRIPTVRNFELGTLSGGSSSAGLASAQAQDCTPSGRLIREYDPDQVKPCVPPLDTPGLGTNCSNTKGVSSIDTYGRWNCSASDFAKSGQDCAGGSYLTGVNAAGNVTCQAAGGGP